MKKKQPPVTPSGRTRNMLNKKTFEDFNDKAPSPTDLNINVTNPDIVAADQEESEKEMGKDLTTGVAD
jgi:hypothetical protein